MKAHRGQFRKGTKIPYIVHPLRVAEILIDIGCSDEVVLASILHDVVEDSAITIGDIRGLFGQQVAELVAGASERRKSESWEIRKRETIDFLIHAPKDVLFIVCADKLDNIRELRKNYLCHGEAAFSHFNRPKELQEWYYRSLAKIFATCNYEGESIFSEYVREVNVVFGGNMSNT